MGLEIDAVKEENQISTELYQPKKLKYN